MRTLESDWKMSCARDARSHPWHIQKATTMAGGWASLGLLPDLVRTIEDEFRWSLPTAIQGMERVLHVCSSFFFSHPPLDEAIPLILGGSDVMASAETG